MDQNQTVVDSALSEALYIIMLTCFMMDVSEGMSRFTMATLASLLAKRIQSRFSCYCVPEVLDATAFDRAYDKAYELSMKAIDDFTVDNELREYLADELVKKLKTFADLQTRFFCETIITATR